MRIFSFSNALARTGAVVLSVLLLAACSRTEEPDAKQAAVVQYTFGEPIADSTLALIVTIDGQTDTLAAAFFYQQYYGTLQQDPFLAGDSLRARELRRSIAEGFVFQNVLGALARRETGLTVDTAQADAYIASVRQQIQSQNSTLEAELAREGMTLPEFRTRLIDRLRVEAMMERLAERAPQPTEAEIATYRQEQAEEVRLQHILFLKYPGLSPAQLDSLENRAQAVLDSARKGTSFADLARRNSQAGNAATGGDLDYISRASGLPDEVAEAAFALRDSGDVAPKVIETPFGYHLLRLTGRRTAVPMDTLTARGQLLTERRGETVEKAVKDAVNTLGTVVRVNPNVIKADLNSPLED